MGYGPTQIPLAIGEAVFSAAVLRVMFNRRPDLLYRVKLSKEAKVNVAGI